LRNFSSSPSQPCGVLLKGWRIGLAPPVSILWVIIEQVPKSNFLSFSEIPMLPDHLVDLYEKSSEKLISHKHKVKFAEVLFQNSDAFSRNKKN
jgi:hypothetical protein